MKMIVLKTKQKLNIPFHIEKLDISNTEAIHSHDCFEITYVFRGKAVHSIGDMSYPIPVGAFFVVSNMLSHAIIPEEDFECYRILFDKEIVADCFETFKKDIGFVRMFMLSSTSVTNNSHFSRLLIENEELQNKFQIIFEKLLAEYTRGGYDGLIMIKNLLSELIILTIRSYADRIARKNNINALMAGAGGYIEENLGNPIKVETLAKRLNLSTRHFNRAFKNFFGLSPLQFITYLRINKAKGMLVFTTINITEIANACGFYDCTHFCKTFKQQTGVSPKTYRKKALSI